MKQNRSKGLNSHTMPNRFLGGDLLSVQYDSLSKVRFISIDIYIPAVLKDSFLRAVGQYLCDIRGIVYNIKCTRPVL